MERTVSERRIRRLRWVVSICFVLLTAWLFCKEGPYIKIMDISVVPERGRIQVGVLAGGENIKVSAGDKEVSLFVEEQEEAGMTHLMIYGESEESRETSVDIKVVSDSSGREEDWKYRVLAGKEAGETLLWGSDNNERYLYLIMCVLVVTIIAVAVRPGKKDRLQKELESYADAVIRKLEQEPGMERCCREGRRLFAAYESQEILVRLLFPGLWMFWYCRLVHSMTHEVFSMQQIFGSRVWVGAAVIGALNTGAFMRWGSFVSELLTRDCRPVTAAVTYLLMGNYGAGKRWSRFLLYHNGAAGLYRSGHCREALEISDLAWKTLSKKPRDHIVFVHYSLRYQCLKVLEEDADREKQYMEALLEKNPGWKKRKNIQRFLGIQDICQRIEAGEVEQAEKSAKEILGQWKEGYYRLPVLGLMAELKEVLGKEQEAAELRSQILTFSPENKEVRQVMGEGRLTYSPGKARTWDLRLTAVLAVCVCGIFLNFFFT